MLYFNTNLVGTPNWQAVGGRHGDDHHARRGPQFALRTSFKRPLAVDARKEVPDMGEGPIDG